jgi:hypothetical protein
VILEAHAPAPVYLYSHWGGSELPNVLAAALERGKGRWDDAPYLTRIIFNEMTKGNEDGETGYGISSYYCDGNHDLLVVDIDKNVVRTCREGSSLTAGDGVPFSQATAETLQSLYR